MLFSCFFLVSVVLPSSYRGFGYGYGVYYYDPYEANLNSDVPKLTSPVERGRGRGRPGKLNFDLAELYNGTLLLTTSSRIVELRGTKPDVKVAGISSLEAKGPGCFFLYKYPNYRGHI